MKVLVAGSNVVRVTNIFLIWRVMAPPGSCTTKLIS